MGGKGEKRNNVSERMHRQMQLPLFLEIPSLPTSEPESLGTPLVPLPPFDNRISECSDDSLEPP